MQVRELARREAAIVFANAPECFQTHAIRHADSLKGWSDIRVWECGTLGTIYRRKTENFVKVSSWVPAREILPVCVMTCATAT